MKESVQRKLESLTERFEEVQALVSQPEIIADQDKYRALTKEYSQLEGVVKCFADYQSAQQDFESAQEMICSACIAVMLKLGAGKWKS